MICFVKSSLMVIFIFGLTMFDLLIMLLILTIFLEDRVKNVSLIWIMSSMLIFEV